MIIHGTVSGNLCSKTTAVSGGVPIQQWSVSIGEEVKVCFICQNVMAEGCSSVLIHCREC